ncbi:MAG: DNA translocase FtsK [Clostridiales bacterium]|nr:DNA translocase FtsK [Clostridiales bacterium]
MAAHRKSSAGRRSSGRKRKKTARKRSTNGGFSWKSEVFLFVVLAFCVILFITNIGKGGAVGEGFSHFFFGLFGIMSYIFPVVLFLIVAFAVSNHMSGKKNKRNTGYPGRAAVKTCAAVVCYVFVCAILHIVFIGKASTDLSALFKSCADGKTAGGILGGAVASALLKAFGMAGAWIITIIVLVLCVVLITERSLFRGISNKYSDSREHAPERIEHRKEVRAEKAEVRAENKAAREDEARRRAEEERVRRTEKRVSGVTTDTKLEPPAPSEPEINVSASEGMSEVDMSGITDDDSVPFDEDLIVPEPTIQVSGQYDGLDETVPEETSEELSVKAAATGKKKAKASAKQSAGTAASQVAAVGAAAALSQTGAAAASDYVFPDIRLLKKGDPNKTGDSRTHLKQMSDKLQETLQTFGVNARVTNVICGPSVTQYEVQPEMGVKVSKILNLADDIKLNLMVSDIRIEAPIPGKAAIGIEVPNKENVTVAFRDLVESPEFRDHKSVISFCAGKDIAGHTIVADIAKMPHLLIAGATGSGKSVCINTIIMSILFKARPDQVKLIMIDPKVVELSVYNSIPHMLIPVVTDPKKAAGALNWAVAEMTDRYNKFAEYGVRDMEGYNKKVDSVNDIEDEDKPQRMPNIVIIVDELADLMMVAAGDVEDAICRLAQLARAAGIHLVIATQRPSVNVITGLIKANMPSRIAFAVTSGVDSRTILDMNGAEKLLGKGDMLFYPQGYAKPLRVQGAFVSDAEVAAVVDDIVEKNGRVDFSPDIEEKVKTSESSLGSGSSAGGFPSTDDGRDSYFYDAAVFLIEKEKGSIGMLQRNFKIGFNRAARIMDQLADAGVVGPEEGTKPRRVLMTMEEYEAVKDEL